jgi:hypothetical protein
VLLVNVIRRISLLSYFHCGCELPRDVASFLETARAVTTRDARLRWQAWERASTRQRRRVPMGGFLGQVTYHGDLAPFWPWLVLGELVHVGKGATFGLGQYRLEPAGVGAAATVGAPGAVGDGLAAGPRHA